MSGLAIAFSVLGWLFLALAFSGAAYMLFAIVVTGRPANDAPAPPGATPITILKPLYGDEPRLRDNLATFLAQDHVGPIQLLCGVGSADDSAVAAVEALRAAHPDAAIDLVIDPTRHGSNAKIGNLLNMMPHARHDMLVLSDSDMAVPRDYLSHILAALDAPGVGAVSCLYRGRGDAGSWSTLCAGSISYAFLPALLVGRALRLAEPCMGSTIALRRSTLDAIGGLAPFADILADDYAIGEAVRGLGLSVAIPSMVLAHGFAETGLGAVWRQELRWAVTTRRLAPAGYAGTIVLHPVPFALLALPFAPLPAAAALVVALAVRLALKARVDRRIGTATMPGWWLPLRDVLSFTVFVASFFARSVAWRGARLALGPDGRMTASRSFPE